MTRSPVSAPWCGCDHWWCTVWPLWPAALSLGAGPNRSFIIASEDNYLINHKRFINICPQPPGPKMSQDVPVFLSNWCDFFQFSLLFSLKDYQWWFYSRFVIPWFKFSPQTSELVSSLSAPDITRWSPWSRPAPPTSWCHTSLIRF